MSRVALKDYESEHQHTIYADRSCRRGEVSHMLGWIVICLSGLYAGRLLIEFLIAVPPPEYMISRIIVVISGLIVGWSLRKRI